MISTDKVIEIFSLADDFCKLFGQTLRQHQIPTTAKLRPGYHRPGRLSDAEIMTILILFHLMGYRCLKHFYTEQVCKNMKDLFPNTVSYSRFVTLQKSVMVPLTIFIKEVLLGKCTGITFVDSTPL